MRQVLPLAALLAAASLLAPAVPSVAQPVPAGANPVTGARPGNPIGTGQSLPMSPNASNITPGDTRSPIAPRLPTPPIGDDATMRQYLTDARRALTMGRTGEGQEALERAETRQLDRSVDPRLANQPDNGPVVSAIRTARDALARRDIPRAIQTIDALLAR